MDAEQIRPASVEEAFHAIEAVGSSNSLVMATRAIQVNVLIRNVPGDQARLLKSVYNDIGAEVAISSDAYYGHDGRVTDMIVMGTVYHHREAQRILQGRHVARELTGALENVVETAEESKHPAVES